MPKIEKVQKSENAGYYADVMICCVPLLVMSWFYYGPRPLMLSLAAVITAYVCDCVVAPLHGNGYRPHEASSECFALLIAMMLPATVRYSVLMLAVAVAVIMKEAFGGEGHYPFHPAAVGMAVVAISWPNEVFRYPAPGTQLPVWGAVNVPLTGGMNATLAAGGLPTASTLNLVTGNVAGPMGTCAALVIAACGLFLLARGRLRLSTVVPYFAACILLAWLFPRLNELPALSLPWQYVRQRIYLEKYILLAGSTLFCGVFLAGEPVTQPNRTGSRMAYGAVLGAATVAFRYFSSYEVGVCFALLLVDAIPEWLDSISRRAAQQMRFVNREEELRRGKRAEAEPKQQ